jgi:hypothetical protein
MRLNHLKRSLHPYQDGDFRFMAYNRRLGIRLLLVLLIFAGLGVVLGQRMDSGGLTSGPQSASPDNDAQARESLRHFTNV